MTRTDHRRSRPPTPRTTAAADPTWSDLYRAGAVAALGYILLGILAPALTFMPIGYERGMDGHALLGFIADHRTWWWVLQTLTLGPSFLAIPVFLAIFVSLKDANKSYAAIGSVLAVGCQLLFVSFYPGTLGLAYLSDMYSTAEPSRQASLAAAAEGVTAPLDAYNPLYETVFALSILLLSVVMLHGPFPRGVAYLGIAAAAAELVAVSLIPFIGMGYFWWWLGPPSPGEPHSGAGMRGRDAGRTEGLGAEGPGAEGPRT